MGWLWSVAVPAVETKTVEMKKRGTRGLNTGVSGWESGIIWDIRSDKVVVCGKVVVRAQVACHEMIV